jgi:S1-C subfamily serine protease
MGRAAAAWAAVCLVAALSAGCGDDDQGGSGVLGGGSSETRTTRVEVVQGIGEKGGFDPRSIYERLAPGVVTIISLFDGRGSLLGDGAEGGQGSGFVLDGDGYVATNAHVVTAGEAPRTRRAKHVYVDFSEGDRVPARVVGTDPNADVALLKIDPEGLSLTPLRLGSSKDLRVGAPVAAIGSPFGERQSLSVGVISALDRNIQSLTAFSIGDAIQTDAAVNPGNSGGPLLNSRGQVVGINSQIKSESGGGEGVGFAVPVDAVRRSVRELRDHGRVDYGYLGVSAQSLYPQLARRLGLSVADGALIGRVEKGSPAEKAGLEAGKDKINFQGERDIPKGGDVIVAVDGEKLTPHRDLADLVSRRDAGETVKLEVVRGDKRRTVEVKLGHRPARPPSARP